MDPFWQTLLATVLGGGVIAAIIGLINDRIKFKEVRKAAKEDRALEKADKVSTIEKMVENQSKELTELQEMQKAQSEALKVILLDRVLHLGKGYIDDGEITFDDRRRLKEMHGAYHTGLHGNGDADLIMSAVDELPLKT